jgi:hypothetical protein
LPSAAAEANLSQIKQYFMELDSHEVTKIVPASQAWVNWGRKLLCEEKDFVRNSNLERLQTWQRRMPAPMTDEFGLARHWPCYMESLRPFPESDNELMMYIASLQGLSASTVRTRDS